MLSAGVAVVGAAVLRHNGCLFLQRMFSEDGVVLGAAVLCRNRCACTALHVLEVPFCFSGGSTAVRRQRRCVLLYCVLRRCLLFVQAAFVE